MRFFMGYNINFYGINHFNNDNEYSLYASKKRSSSTS
jgi:hypothetical protein